MHCLIKTNLYSIIFLQKDLKSKKHLINAMTIETTILDFQPVSYTHLTLPTKA